MKESLIAGGVMVVSVTFALLIAAQFGAFDGIQVFGGAGGVGARECTVSTVEAATVGDDVSSTILAEYSNRAWAIIEQPTNATNTVSVSFDEGAAATVNGGVQLTPATTTSSKQATEPFGLNTDFAYTGAVTGITSTGSTTVRITECRY